jgi:hypothetical protein
MSEHMTPVMYTDYSGMAPECWIKIREWFSKKRSNIQHDLVNTMLKISKISHDLKEIFHENSTALIYRNGFGLGGTLLDTGLYYSEGFEGYYIDGHSKHQVINGQRIDLFIFSYTAVQIEDGTWTGSAGPSLGPISFENYGPEWYQWSLYVTVGSEGGLGYSAGTSYSVDVIGYVEDLWNYIFKED